jgi:hypothetical protein
MTTTSLRPKSADRWFLVLIKKIVDFEEELAEAKNQSISRSINSLNEYRAVMSGV